MANEQNNQGNPQQGGQNKPGQQQSGQSKPGQPQQGGQNKPGQQQQGGQHKPGQQGGQGERRPVTGNVLSSQGGGVRRRAAAFDSHFNKNPSTVSA